MSPLIPSFFFFFSPSCRPTFVIKSVRSVMFSRFRNLEPFLFLYNFFLVMCDVVSVIDFWTWNITHNVTRVIKKKRGDRLARGFLFSSISLVSWNPPAVSYRLLFTFGTAQIRWNNWSLKTIKSWHPRQFWEEHVSMDLRRKPRNDSVVHGLCFYHFPTLSWSQHLEAFFYFHGSRVELNGCIYSLFAPLFRRETW